jgi:hypothetical protein
LYFGFITKKKQKTKSEYIHIRLCFLFFFCFFQEYFPLTLAVNAQARVEHVSEDLSWPIRDVNARTRGECVSEGVVVLKLFANTQARVVHSSEGVVVLKLFANTQARVVHSSEDLSSVFITRTRVSRASMMISGYMNFVIKNDNRKIPLIVLAIVKCVCVCVCVCVCCLTLKNDITYEKYSIFIIFMKKMYIIQIIFHYQALENK